MKSFEELFAELQEKAKNLDPDSETVVRLQAGTHEIGKKLVEEAAEVWMAARYESREHTAKEISQLLYHTQAMMLACDLSPEDVYRYL